MMFEEHSRVRVTALIQPNRPFIGSERVRRAPQVGDVGTVVDIYGDGEAYTVEMADADGLAIWIADFAPEELAAA